MRAPSTIAGSAAATVRPARAGLPAPERLAAVATVLCVRPRRHRDALDGWLAACSAERVSRQDGENACEALLFRDAAGRVCWRLYLLPDSDFLAWDDAAADLPAHRGSEARSGVWVDLRRRWLRRLRGRWCAQVLRLQVLRDDAGHCVLLADGAELSALGHARARRIAAGEGARLQAQADVCCCMASGLRDGAGPAQFA
ncbi:Hemin transport protein [Lysobacter sp. CA199]|uniref:Hemin transport protein n=1 Tax=Lysobacter sp. CA199 TaxID=3455608 RepID=UPI003F8D0F9D